MQTFRKWNGKKIEDWGTTMSDDAKSFYRAFKNYLKREFPDAEIIGFKPNHYDASGFIKLPDGRCIYVSHNIDRGRERVDFNDDSVRNGVLYRTATDEKDYRGGSNNFCSLFKLGNCLRNLFDRMDVPEQTVKESKQLNEKLYSWDEIQDMVTDCHNDPKLKKKVLGNLTTAGPLGKKDKADTEYVIDMGYADAFERFDSAVTDNFITAYLRAKGIEEASVNEDKNQSFEIYRGYDISYNFYGEGEYTVQYDGDDVFFKTKKEAQQFIDNMVDGTETPVEEASGFKEYELELEYDVTFKKDLTDDDYEKLIKDLKANNEPKILAYKGTSKKTEGLYLTVYWHFMGKITWDQDGRDVWGWEFDGAPDNESGAAMIDELKKIISYDSLHLSEKLSMADIDIECISADSIEDQVATMVENDPSNYEYEAISLDTAVHKILEGASLDSVVTCVKESIDFKSWGNDSKVKSYHFDSVEDLKAAWEKGEGVPDNDDPVADVVINGKSVYVGPTPESSDPEDADNAWFEDILTYCGVDIWK